MRQARPPRRNPHAGVTLVEVLVALVIFALIGAAGFTVLDQVARVERLTEGRLARLEAAQRTLRVIAVDFGQARAQSLVVDAAAVALQRSGGAGFPGPVSVSYGVTEAGLIRVLAGRGGAVVSRQILLAGVGTAQWRFLDGNGVWQTEWPPADATASLAGPENPRAVAVTLALATGGSLRRVAMMPGRAP